MLIWPGSNNEIYTDIPIIQLATEVSSEIIY